VEFVAGDSHGFFFLGEIEEGQAPGGGLGLKQFSLG
jgi:hypothetical protein